MTEGASSRKSEELLSLLQSKLGSQILKGGVELGDVVVHVAPASAHGFFQILKMDTELRFNLLLDVTAVDWMDTRPDRFELVYHLLSLQTLHRVRVKIDLPESQSEVDSIVDLWSGANYLEREVWDMYGIRFKGHPDLRRILMYDEFDGYPLRKDYPVQGKQPRIPLRSPEVRNTALDMKRPTLANPLVKINPRKRSEESARS